MSADEDDYFYQMDAAMAQLEEDVLKRTSTENVKSFLGSNGDAIAKRVSRLVESAELSRSQGNFAGSVIAASTCIELIIRYLLILPLVQGAFLPNEIAAILTSRIGLGRSIDDRKLLPVLLKTYGIDLSTMKTASGRKLWPTFQEKVLESRNLAVHQGDPCSRQEADTALECLHTFQTDLVSRISDRLGFTIARTGRWSSIEFGDPNDLSKPRGGSIFDTTSPFTRPDKD